MSTQRYISTSFWDDEWIRKLNPSERYIYLYLLTNPLTNIAGVYKTTMDRICFDTGYEPKVIETIFKRFSADRKAFFHNGYIIIPSWPKYQKADQRSKIRAGIEAIIKELPFEIIEFLKKIGYKYPINASKIPYAYDTNYSDSDSDSDSEFDSEFDLLCAKPDDPDIQQKGDEANHHEDITTTTTTTVESKKIIQGEPPIIQSEKHNGKSHLFHPPSLEEVTEYCNSRENGINPEQFIDYYESKGWIVGRTKMKDWRAAVRTWERNEIKQSRASPYRDEEAEKQRVKGLVDKYFRKEGVRE